MSSVEAPFEKQLAGAGDIDESAFAAYTNSGLRRGGTVDFPPAQTSIRSTSAMCSAT